MTLATITLIFGILLLICFMASIVGYKTTKGDKTIPLVVLFMNLVALVYITFMYLGLTGAIK